MRRIVLAHDAVYQTLVSRCALNPSPATLVSIATHCEVMANLAWHEGDVVAWVRYLEERDDWVHAYRAWRGHR